MINQRAQLIRQEMTIAPAVADDLERQAPDEILVGGDLVGRGPEGGAVVDRIRATGWPCVRGNHEDFEHLGVRQHCHVPPLDWPWLPW